MKYCADTWFLLNLFSKDEKSLKLIEETRRGKTRIDVPMIVYAEATKKLMQYGVSKKLIEDFFLGC